MASMSAAGGSSTATETVRQKVAVDTNGNVFKVPDYTIKELLRAIPAHCYERSLVRSMGYVLRDIACILTTGYLAQCVLYPYVADMHVSVRFVFWFAYSLAQGLFCTGLWVLAHECGHQAFSDYGAINDLTGWILHSYLLVPYFSWKYSHAKHHKGNGHMSRDMVFVPPRAQEYREKRGIIGELAEHSGDSPLRTLSDLVTQQLFGWLMYLTTNVTGQKYPGRSKWTQNHFWPFSPVFEKRDALFILLSDLGILTQLLVLRVWYLDFGAWSVFIHWFVPYIWVNHWLVFVTFLQHTDTTIGRYETEEWTFARGAACTIDRELPFIGPHLFHDIIETHVVHHYSSRIPFYNAREASEAIQKVMGEHYRKSTESMWVTLWRAARGCQYVDGDNGVMMYRNINGIGVGTGPEAKKTK
ncbi:AFR589Cp [Eremothecium gossypii ATCC 10895]|uniref:AFR589Cp n=1 Tax=Eremothecium gossypii (strain ATCC 10895 / CBS 109.51 / FGSC 9923 / NRRL Y-1056) TaxID=284811 RepID=Q752I6_EREGS|nr:AFR589Cp [Eremothecium gossypii ATCC 10895]AAS53960.1 AFR589Cp [Eremothecium gossypii ATCC 10895]